MALSIATPIMTTSGWKTAGTIVPGDYVFADDGSNIPVDHVKDITASVPCYQITFGEKAQLITDGKQEFFTWPYKTRWAAEDNSRSTSHTTRKVTTKVIQTTLLYGGRRPDHGVQLANPPQHTEKVLPIHPYVLGAWLGDGDSTGARFSNNDYEIIEFIREAGYPARKSSGKDPYLWLLTDGIRFGVDSKVKDCLNSRLRKNNLLKNKHIPELYLQSSISQRTLLLQGLMDTDGSCKEGGHCIFVNTNRILAESVCELVISLGAKATIILEKSNQWAKNENWKQPYAVRFSPAFPVFRLKRKLERQRLIDVPLNRRFHYASNVEEIDSVPVREIYLQSQQRLIQVGRDCIPSFSA